jgi:hypothetical protein
MSYLYADSDILNGPAFQPYLTQMVEALQALLDGTGPPLPVQVRAQIDAVVNQALPESWETLLAMAQGLLDLPLGDAEQVKELAALIIAAEAAATETSANAFPDPLGGHSYV